MRTHPIYFIAGALVAAVPIFMSCGSHDDPLPRPRHDFDASLASDPDAGNDSGLINIDPCARPGHAGCPCTEVGAIADCGQIEYQNGDYITCAMGQSTCDGTKWGACMGNRIVAQSLPGHALTPAGRRLLSTTRDCQSPCDPFCTQVVGQTSDVDAGLITITDAGGITLLQSVGAGPGSGPCKGLWCNVDACPGLPKTSLSGIVYDPAGKVPLYNAYVYVPVDPSAGLPAFTSGSSCDTCAGATDVSAVAVAQTGADGKFTLNNVPYGDNIVALVVQMGKWRRMVYLPSVTKCQNNVVDPQYSRLPRNSTDGYNNKADIPRIAIASGDADPFECLLLKAGIDPAEIDVPSKGKRIDYYKYNGIDRSPGGAPAGTTLTGSVATLKNYDVVLLPCEGGEKDHLSHAPNLVTYANGGGRVFTTHFGYTWLATPNPAGSGTATNATAFYGTANWRLNKSDYNDPMTGNIDQSFPKGVAFAQWLKNVGSSSTQGQLSINEPRHDALTAISPSQRWVYGTSTSSTAAYQPMLLSMTFNTPIGIAEASQCGRVVFSDFHVSADALVGSSTSCHTGADCGFTATCNGAKAGTCSAQTCKSDATCASGFTCDGEAQGNCSTQSCHSNSECGTGRACDGGSQGTCGTACYQNSECGSWSSCSNGSIGSCSTPSCKANTDCGNGTCSGATVGQCTPPATSCWAKADCASLNASANCTGAVTGTCSTACKSSTDCGTSESCSGASIGQCTPQATTCWANADCSGLNASSTCGGAVTGTCSTACKTSADCGGDTCGGAAIGQCTPQATSCYTDSDCTSSLNASSTCSGESTGTCGGKILACSNSGQCGVNGTCSSAKTCVNAAGTSSHGTCSNNGNCNPGETCTKICGAQSCTSNSNCGTGRTCSGLVAGTCTGPTRTCWSNSDCLSLNASGKYTCNNPVLGSCPAKTGCRTDTDCGGTRTCDGETIGACTGPTQTCWSNNDCLSLNASGKYTCNGATIGSCPAKSGCKSDTDCGGARTCDGETVGVCTGPTQTCWGNSDCLSLNASGKYTCNNPVLGTCAALSCKANSDCGGTRTCSGQKQGVCSSWWGNNACSSSSDCSWGQSCIGGTAGTCAAGICYSDSDCGSSGTCASGTLGACKRGCSTDADCGKLSCVAGQCQGCLQNSYCGSNNCVGDVTGTCSASGSMFPLTCLNADLSAQEKALEFMFFDLSACVSPDSWAPPVPTITYSPVTFTLDFESSCATGQLPIWREFDWKAEIPTGTNIVYSVQTADTIANLTTATSAALATATSSTVAPNWDVAIIETTAGGAFLSVTPRLTSLAKLRVTVTLNPSSDKKAAPTLNSWQVGLDCVDRQ